MLEVLFADGFNVQQTLAAGVIGAGIAGTVAAGLRLKQQMEKRKQEAQEAGGSAKMGDLYVKLILVMAVGMAVIMGGVAWRASVTQPTSVRR